MIIGKGGETIKRLAAESGAKIQFKPDGMSTFLKMYMPYVMVDTKDIFVCHMLQMTSRRQNVVR